MGAAAAIARSLVVMVLASGVALADGRGGWGRGGGHFGFGGGPRGGGGGAAWRSGGYGFGPWTGPLAVARGGGWGYDGGRGNGGYGYGHGYGYGYGNTYGNGYGGWRYDPYDESPIQHVDPRLLVLPDDSPQRRTAVDDEWVRGASAWVKATDDTAECFARLAWVAERGQWFLADQVAAMIALCGDGGEPMLRATALFGRRIVDANNAALRIVALFPLSEDKQKARTMLPSTPPEWLPAIERFGHSPLPSPILESGTPWQFAGRSVRR